MTENVKTDAIRICIGNFALGIVMVLIFSLLGYFSAGVIWGALLGCSFVSLSFFWLSYAVSKYVERDSKSAQSKISSTYAIRLLLTAAMVITAVKLPFFNAAAAIIPLFYQRIVIIYVSRIRSKADERGE